MGTLNNMMTNDDIVTVEWPNFGQALGHDMWQFCMAHEYSDVTICTAERHEIPSHRIILAMCSPYFRDLFKLNRTAIPIVCLSDIRYDIVTKILQLIYRGVVEVPACEMRSFIKAAKYLKLQGFDNVEPSRTVNDMFGPVPAPASKRCFSIKLKRIDEDENFAMDTADVSDDEEYADDRPNQTTMANGDDPNGEDNHSSNSSDSSDDENVNGVAVNGGGDGGDADVDIDVIADDDDNIGKNMAPRIQNAFPLSSSSSESFGSPDDDNSEVAANNN